jgi:WD40 repeat protein
LDGPVWSPDCKRVALNETREGRVIRCVVMDASTRTAVTRLERRGIVCWSPDGTRVITVSTVGSGPERTFAIAEAGTWRRLKQVSGRVTRASHFAWAPDGKTVAFGVHYSAGRPGEFGWLVDAASGEVLHGLSNTDGATWGIGWSPDSSCAVFIQTESSTSSGKPELAAYDRNTGLIRFHAVGPKAPIFQVVWPPDLKGPVAIASDGRRVEVWEWELLASPE